MTYILLLQKLQKLLKEVSYFILIYQSLNWCYYFITSNQIHFLYKAIIMFLYLNVDLNFVLENF